jgi:hypothetical protein
VHVEIQRTAEAFSRSRRQTPAAPGTTPN